MQQQPVSLIADDSDDDLLLISRAFQKANIPNPVYTVNGGNEAIAYLSGEGKYSDRRQFPLPDLFLLDLKMPGTNGLDVLAWLRKQPAFHALRVVVLTSSKQIHDVSQAFLLGANLFLVKPTDFQDFVELSKGLHTYWLRNGNSFVGPPLEKQKAKIEECVVP